MASKRIDRVTMMLSLLLGVWTQICIILGNILLDVLISILASVLRRGIHGACFVRLVDGIEGSLLSRVKGGT